MNGGEARNGMVEQKFVSVMYSDLEGPPIFTDCCFQLGLAILGTGYACTLLKTYSEWVWGGGDVPSYQCPTPLVT